MTDSLQNTVIETQSDASLNTVEIDLTSGIMRVEVCSDNIIHVLYSPSKNFPQNKSLSIFKNVWEPAVCDINEEEDDITLVTSRLMVRINRATGSLTFCNHLEDIVLEEPSTGGKEMTPAMVVGESTCHIEQRFVARSDEAIYGLGQHPEGLYNYKGHAIFLEQGNTRVSFPVLLSNLGYGLVWDNCSFTQCDFRDNGGGQYSIWSEVGEVIDYYFIYGPDFDTIVSGYREITGTAPMYAKWAYGLWQSKNRYKDEEEVVNIVKRYRDKGYPLDAIVLDWKYWGRFPWNSMRFDPETFPHPEKMIETLHQKYNAHLMISVWARFARSREGAGSPIFDEMNAKGYLLPMPPLKMFPLNSVNSELRNSHYYDPFMKEARDLYWKGMKKAFFDIGTDAWWLDSTEPLFHKEVPIRFHDMPTSMGAGAKVLNAYSLMTTKAVYEGQRKSSNEKRVYILTRSAFTGQQRYAATTWSGDIMSTWDVFKKQIPAGLNFCMTGIPYWATDIGGFFLPKGPDGKQEITEDFKELFVRWFQYGAFSPVFRIHGTSSEREIWSFGEDNEKIMASYDHLRYRLMPYIYSMAWMTTSKGYTIMRGLPMDFRTDPKALDIDDQFMFGPAFLVNPVTDPGVSNREVYLPGSSTWIDFQTGRKLEGGQTISAAAPLETMPLYVRGGSIVPMGPFIQYTDEKPADPVEIRVYRGDDVEFVLYEDEGDNYNYEEGIYSTIPFSWNEAKRELIIGGREGEFPGMLKERTFHIVWVREGHGIGLPITEIPDVIVPYTGKRVTVKCECNL